jgi:DNA polymerase elongation subunit (family B)
MPADKAGDRVKFFILEVQQRSGGEAPEIMMWGRTDKGEPALVIDRSFRPYFYVEPARTAKKDLDELMRKISELKYEGSNPEKVEVVEKKFFGKEKKMMKITLTKPSDVQKFRDLLKEWVNIKGQFEYAITFYRRYMVDRGITPLTWVWVEGARKVSDAGHVIIEAVKVEAAQDDAYPEPRVLAFDLELVDQGGEESIIMASLRDNKGLKKVLTYKKVDVDFIELVKDEPDLIRRLMDVVRARDPDIITTYNGDRFDFVHLTERAKKFGIKLAMGRTDREVQFKRRGRVYSAWIEGRVHVDIFDFIENILAATLSSEVLSLDMVSREIIGKGKRKIEWEEMQRAWEESRGLEQVVKYCLNDSELTLSLAKALLPQIFELCRITGQTPFDTSRMTYSQLVEWLLIRRAHGTGELIPNRPKFEEIRIRRKAAPYTGGYIYPPEAGIHQKIALFDFMSLYPSITITHNVSPETLYCQCCGGEKGKEKAHKVPGEDYYYCKRHPGFVTRTLEDLVKMRFRIKEKLKGLEPHGKGYAVLDNRQQALKLLANASYGYYGYAGSRWYSRVCAKSITAWGRYYIQRVIKRAQKLGYEVIYGDTDSLFLKVGSLSDANEFLSAVNRSLPGVMELEFQGLYKSGLFTPAKSGLTAKKRYALIDEDGDITIRGFEKVRRDWSQIARNTQERVLLAILRDNSPDMAVRIARKTINDIMKGRIKMKDLVIRTQLTRPLKEYEQIGPHVVAARKAISRGRPVAQGSLIAYVITKGTGLISDRAEPAEDAHDYDPDYYVNNQVIPAAMRVLSGLGYTEEDLTGEEQAQQSLDRFVRKSLKSKIGNGIKKFGRKRER